MATHEITITDQIVDRLYGSYPGTVARCTCGWSDSYGIRDGSAEASAAEHMRRVQP